MKLIPTEIHENGDLIKIEYYDSEGEFVIEAVWDPTDPQDAEHRIKFRKWATQMLKRLDYEVHQ